MVADAGKVVFKEGDTGSHMYIIRSGSVKISRKVDDKEIVLTILQAGDFFGEMALISNTVRTATATVVTTASLLVLNRSNFVEMVQKNGLIALNIIDKLCRRIENTNRQLQLIIEKDHAGLFAQNLYYAFRECPAGAKAINYLDFCREISMNIDIPSIKMMQLIDYYKAQRIIDIANAKIVLLDEAKLKLLAKI